MPNIKDHFTQLILKGFFGGKVFLGNLYRRNFHTDKGKEGRLFPTLYPVRNNAPLLSPSQRLF
jgi:hypothetical protein